MARSFIRKRYQSEVSHLRLKKIKDEILKKVPHSTQIYKNGNIKYTLKHGFIVINKHTKFKSFIVTNSDDPTKNVYIKFIHLVSKKSGEISLAKAYLYNVFWINSNDYKNNDYEHKWIPVGDKVKEVWNLPSGSIMVKEIDVIE